MFKSTFRKKILNKIESKLVEAEEEWNEAQSKLNREYVDEMNAVHEAHRTKMEREEEQILNRF